MRGNGKYPLSGHLVGLSISTFFPLLSLDQQLAVIVELTAQSKQTVFLFARLLMVAVVAPFPAISYDEGIRYVTCRYFECTHLTSDLDSIKHVASAVVATCL